MTTNNKLSIERRGHVLLMGFDRAAKRNAFDVDMYLALAGAYGELDRDPELRCGLLFGHGEHFTAGLALPQWGPVLARGEWIHLPDGRPEGRGVGKGGVSTCRSRLSPRIKKKQTRKVTTVV